MYHKTIKVFFSYSTSQAQESFGGGLSKYLHSLENCLSCQFVKMKGNWPLLTNWNATTELMNEAMANTIPKVRRMFAFLCQNTRLRILAHLHTGDLVYEFFGIKQRGAKLARHTCVWFVKKPWDQMVKSYKTVLKLNFIVSQLKFIIDSWLEPSHHLSINWLSNFLNMRGALSFMGYFVSFDSSIQFPNSVIL